MAAGISNGHSQIRITVKGLPVGGKRRRVVDQRRRQVVARLELVDLILAVALGIGVVADEDLDFRVRDRECYKSRV